MHQCIIACTRWCWCWYWCWWLILNWCLLNWFLNLLLFFWGRLLKLNNRQVNKWRIWDTRCLTLIRNSWWWTRSAHPFGDLDFIAPTRRRFWLCLNCTHALLITIIFIALSSPKVWSLTWWTVLTSIILSYHLTVPITSLGHTKVIVIHLFAFCF